MFGYPIWATSSTSNWTPTVEGSHLKFWVRSDNVTATGTDATGWPDLSGNGLDLMGGGGALDPIYNSSDANFNNRPSVGTTPGVDEIRFFTVSPVGNIVGTTATWAQVINCDAGANPSYLRLNVSGSTTDSHSLIVAMGSTSISVGDGGGSPAVVTISPNTTYIIISVYDGAGNVNVYLNGSTTPAGTGTVEGDSCTSLFTGSFDDLEFSRWSQAEIFCVDRAYNSSDLTTTFTYLNNLYKAY